MIKLAIDAMGGDFAPKEIVKGSVLAVKTFEDISLRLYGDIDKIKPYIEDHPRIEVIDTKHYLDMGVENPIAEYRKNKEHSLFKAMKAVSDNEADGIVTAGPTQAVAVGAQFIIKKMDQMRRMGIAPIIPSLDGRGKILLDSGANLELPSEFFVDFAIFANIIAKRLFNIEEPKIGLVNIGVEENKGRVQDVEAYNLLKKDNRFNFIGNVEPKEVFVTDADILLADGFTGNILMKSMEGAATGLGKILKREIKSSFFSKIGALFMRKSLNKFKKSLDASEIGGAMLIGINGIVVKAHGSSSSHAFFNAIRQARKMVEMNIIEEVKKELKKEEGN